MDTTPSEQQQQEITALKSIYADDFIECQPKAWKVRCLTKREIRWRGVLIGLVGRRKAPRVRPQDHTPKHRTRR